MNQLAVDDAWAFARVDEFWSHYNPMTPWGKDEKETRRILVDPALIEARYDDIETAVTWMQSHAGDTVSIDRMSYHLKRLPRIPGTAKDLYELTELFQVKKFLANYRGILTGLGTVTAARFGIEQIEEGRPTGALAAFLSKGGLDPETFHVSDSYDPALAEIRAGIAGVDAFIATGRAQAEAEATGLFGVSFDGREFLVVPREAALAMADSGGRFSLEPYDDTRYTVRILPSMNVLEAMGERERLRESEQKAEERVISRISGLVRQALPDLEIAVVAITRWDLARAGAVLSFELALTRPSIDSRTMVFDDARFVPCQDECARFGMVYAPLSARFDSQAIVLFGSNMGGKTVVLQTVLFFQLVAQAGLFVPAGAFRTHVYERIEYVGERSGERLEGLSGFGLEVWRLGKVREAGSASLVAFDELARTTGSHEAEALLSAVVEAYAEPVGGVCKSAHVRAFFATHFRGVARIPGAEYRKMRGLDRKAVEAAQAVVASRPLAERLSGINHCMKYEVIEDDGLVADSDALAIASLLGLDKSIVERAQWFMNRGSFKTQEVLKELP